MKTNEEFIYDYDHEAVRKKTENSIREESYEQGIEEGIKEGIKQGKIITAKNMLQRNYNDEEIIKLTDLTIEELNKLK